MRIKLMVLSILAASLLVVGVSPAAAQNNSRQVGLVNVSAGDVNLLNNVNLAVAANVLVTACDVTIPIAVLATQVVNDTATFDCEGIARGITIDQSQPGDGAGTPNGGRGNNSRQAGLVNVSLGDVNILNNLNLALAANVLVTACDLTVPIAIAAVQTVNDTSDFTCRSDAGPITITQTQ